MDHSIGNDKTFEFGSGDDGNGYALNPGDVLGQYRVVRQLGRGGMGQVYEVEHTTLGRRYALKLLPEEFTRSANALERFKREAKVMANLEHPNIIRVDEFGETEGRYWLRMELAEGVRLKSEIGNLKPEKCVTLADLAKSMGGKVPQEVLLPILKQVLAGLEYAHSHGAVHRDLKPSNILLTTRSEAQIISGGNREQSERFKNTKGHEKETAASSAFSMVKNLTAKIADFGLVKLVGEEWIQSMVELSVQRSMSLGDERTVAGDSDGTSTKSLLGTYEYMSPEQKRGEEADARSDIYSVGLLVYKLLTGEELGMRTPSQLDSKLNRAWDELVLRALEAPPERRFQSVTKMMAALKPMEGGGSTPLSNQGTTETELTTKYTKDPKVVSDSEEIELTAKERKEHKKDEPVAPVIPSKRKSAVKGIAIGIAVAVLAVGGVFWWQGRDGSPSRPGNAVDGASSSVVHQRQDDAATTKLEASSTLLEESKLEPGQDISIDLGGGEKMEFVWIPALKGWAGKYEVTNGEYRRFKPGHDSGDYQRHSLNDARQPVVQVSWNDTQEYIAWMKKDCELPQGYKLVLPSKEEWLAVAQCGDGRTYPWGNNWPPKSGNYADATAEASFSSWSTIDGYTIDGYTDGFAVSCPVEQSGRNDWGVYGVGGNVWEWTEEKVDSSDYVLRGASWYDGSQDTLRCAIRCMDDASNRNNYFGFRLFLRP